MDRRPELAADLPGREDGRVDVDVDEPGADRVGEGRADGERVALGLERAAAQVRVGRRGQPDDDGAVHACRAAVKVGGLVIAFEAGEPSGNRQRGAVEDGGGTALGVGVRGRDLVLATEERREHFGPRNKGVGRTRRRRSCDDHVAPVGRALDGLVVLGAVLILVVLDRQAERGQEVRGVCIVRVVGDGVNEIGRCRSGRRGEVCGSADVEAHCVGPVL